jgi:hypothetical protein
MEIQRPGRNDNHEIEDELRALEQRLTAWRPARGALDRDQMLYDAGRSVGRADSHIVAWRLATAALFLLLIGSGGLLARQRAVLEHEEYLLAREQSQRLALETTLAAQTRPAPAELAHPLGEPSTVTPFALTSFFVLASREGQGADDSSGPGTGARMPTEAHRRDPKPPGNLRAAAPLRPRDFERVLDL